MPVGLCPLPTALHMKLMLENTRSEISDKYICSELQNWLKVKYLQFSVYTYAFFVTQAISQLCKNSGHPPPLVFILTVSSLQ